MSFKTYLQEAKENNQLLTDLTEKETILELQILNISLALENYDNLTESTINKTKNIIVDYASQVQRNKTLFDYLIDFGKTGGKLILAGIKGDKEKIEELTQKYTKEDFFDFLWKLDLMTLGLITSPLNLIDKFTGWDIKGFLKKKMRTAKSHVKNIVQSIDKLKSDLAIVFKPSQNPDIFNAVDNFKKTLKVKLDPLLKGKIKVSVNKGIRA